MAEIYLLGIRVSFARAERGRGTADFTFAMERKDRSDLAPMILLNAYTYQQS